MANTVKLFTTTKTIIGRTIEVPYAANLVRQVPTKEKGGAQKVTTAKGQEQVRVGAPVVDGKVPEYLPREERLVAFDKDGNAEVSADVWENMQFNRWAEAKGIVAVK